MVANPNTLTHGQREMLTNQYTLTQGQGNADQSKYCYQGASLI
jgi:hypothetical protein